VNNTFIINFLNYSAFPRLAVSISDLRVQVQGGGLESFSNGYLLKTRLIELAYPPFANSSSSSVSLVDGFKIGDRKKIDKSDIVYFDSNGIGSGKHLGWALDTDAQGRVSIAYSKTTHTGTGFNYNQLGNTFGSEKHTLIESEIPFLNIDEAFTENNGDQSVPAGGIPYYKKKTRTIGGGQSHNNVQPSIVELWIKKINNQSGVVDPLILPEAILRGVYDPLVNGALGFIYIDAVTGFPYVWLGNGYAQLGVLATSNNETKTQLVNCVTGTQTYPLDLAVLAKAVFLDGSILYQQNNDYTTVNGSITILTTNYPPLQTGSKLLIFL
jgi:microcystin-dependent protein